MHLDSLKPSLGLAIINNILLTVTLFSYYKHNNILQHHVTHKEKS